MDATAARSARKVEVYGGGRGWTATGLSECDQTKTERNWACRAELAGCRDGWAASLNSCFRQRLCDSIGSGRVFI
jgi:hypothetical protein